MIFSCPRSFVVTCNTMLGSWQDIPRKTFLTLGNRTAKHFCQHVSMKVCFGVCPWRAVLWHKQTKQLPLALPTTLLIAARPPRAYVPAPPPMPSSCCFKLHDCKLPVLREEILLSGCEGSKGSQCLGFRGLKEIRRQCQSSPTGMASPPASLVLPGAGCGMPHTDVMVMPGIVVLLLTFTFSFSPLFPSSGWGWQLPMRRGGAPSAARGVIRRAHHVGFFSTCGFSQSKAVLLCFANILPSKTASNLQLCHSNAYIKPKAKSFKIRNKHTVLLHNYTHKNGRIPIPHSNLAVLC